MIREIEEIIKGDRRVTRGLAAKSGKGGKATSPNTKKLEIKKDAPKGTRATPKSTVSKHPTKKPWAGPAVSPFAGVQKRGRGRPRKTSSTLTTPQTPRSRRRDLRSPTPSPRGPVTPTRGRGRPRKEPATPISPDLDDPNTIVCYGSPPPVPTTPTRGRGRPRKEPATPISPDLDDPNTRTIVCYGSPPVPTTPTRGHGRGRFPGGPIGSLRGPGPGRPRKTPDTPTTPDSDDSNMIVCYGPPSSDSEPATPPKGRGRPLKEPSTPTTPKTPRGPKTPTTPQAPRKPRAPLRPSTPDTPTPSHVRDIPTSRPIRSSRFPNCLGPFDDDDDEDDDEEEEGGDEDDYEEWGNEDDDDVRKGGFLDGLNPITPDIGFPLNTPGVDEFEQERDYYGFDEEREPVEEKWVRPDDGDHFIGTYERTSCPRGGLIKEGDCKKCLEAMDREEELQWKNKKRHGTTEPGALSPRSKKIKLDQEKTELARSFFSPSFLAGKERFFPPPTPKTSLERPLR